MAAHHAKQAHDLVAEAMEEEKRRNAKDLLKFTNDAAASLVLEDISRRLGFLENAMAKPKRAKKRRKK